MRQSLPLLPLCGKQTGVSQVLPCHPFAQVHWSGAVHFPFLQDNVQKGVSHLPGGPMPLAHTEQSSVPQPWAQVQDPVPVLVPLPSQVP